MFKHYFVGAWRNLTRHKLYSAINILGLATGMAACIVIVLFVYYEQSFDSIPADGTAKAEQHRSDAIGGENVVWHRGSAWQDRRAFWDGYRAFYGDGCPKRGAREFRIPV
ncbi:MAG TPA: ABC transporter permease [Puia sp.]|uniref:ABC transporter permease n=1 Tax=Puia sp. TaxID=2045100 RepID=UPI002C0D2032|nr:ABC transporter permease [Puia sp.]HVU99659.1 ABC transporter permease [Puia sp.]